MISDYLQLPDSCDTEPDIGREEIIIARAGMPGHFLAFTAGDRPGFPAAGRPWRRARPRLCLLWGRCILEGSSVPGGDAAPSDSTA
jgi:hypothetical protein